jgi:hypothetical protein
MPGLCARFVCSAFLAAALSRTARADTAEQQADRLFREGVALAQAGRYRDACPRFLESQRIDPGIGTEFDLADCYEHVGRLATAYKMFREVAGIARASGKAEREGLARKRVEALEPRVARLTITARGGTSGLVVRLDGDVLREADIGQALAVEAGEHKVEASAPGKEPWRSSAAVGAAAHAAVDVPPLPDASSHVDVRERGLGTQRVIALGVGGVGIVGVGIGTVFGILSIVNHNAADSDHCSPSSCPTQQGQNDWHSAVVTGNISTFAFVAGGVLLASASALWLTAPSSRSASRARVSPTVDVALAPGGIVARGAF